MQHREIHHLVIHLETQLFQVFGVGRDHPTHGARVVQKLQGEGLAFGIAQSAITVRPAGLGQQVPRQAQMVAQGFTRGGVQTGDGWQGHGLVEHLAGQFVPQRLEQAQLVSRWHPFGLEIAAHEIPPHPRVGLVEQLAVHPLVVHGQANGLAHPFVLELGQAGVEHEALEVARIAVLQLLFDERTVVKQLAFVGPGPFTRHKGLDVIELTRLERLELCGAVLVELVGDAVEIEHAAAHAQVFGPVVGVAHVLDVFAEVGFAQCVRARGDGHIGHHLVKRLAGTPLVAEHWHAADDQRQLGIGTLEIKADLAISEDRHALDLAEIGAKLRSGLFAGEALKGLLHIGGQHRVAIVETGLGVQPEGGREFVGCHAHILGQQAIGGGGLLGIAGEQGFEHQGTDARWRGAFQGERVVLVETGCPGGCHQADVTPFGRDRVHITEIFEAGWVFDVAELGISMGRPSA